MYNLDNEDNGNEENKEDNNTIIEEDADEN